MNMKGVNFKLAVTNTGGPAMAGFQRGLQGIQNQARSTQVAVNNISAAGSSWNRGLNANRRAIQQLGFQMTDFGVQIAGGQNALLAFVQQGGQMLQVFGPAGAIMAAFLTVFGTLGIVAIKTGVTLSQITPILGVLETDFAGLIGFIESAKSVLVSFGQVLMENVDTALIALTITLAYFITKMVLASTTVVAMSALYVTHGLAATAAIVATTALTAAVNFLTAAFMRLAPFLIIAGLSILVKKFLEINQTARVAGSGLDVVAARAKGVDEAIEGLATAGNNYSKAAAAAAMSTSDLVAKYGDLAFMARDALNAIVDVEKVQTILAANAAIDAMADSLLAVQTIAGSGGKGTKLALVGDLGLAAEQAKKLEEAVFALNNAEGLKNQAIEAARLNAQLLQAFGSIDNMPPALQTVYGQIAQIVIKTAEVETMMIATETATRHVGIAASEGAFGLGAMADQARSLADAAASAAGSIWNAVTAMGAALAAKRALLMGSDDERGSQRSFGQEMGAIKSAEAVAKRLAEINSNSGAGGGGGGGGVSDTVKEALDAIKTEADRVKDIFADVASSISDTFMGAFKGVITGTKSVGDAAMEILNNLLDKVIDLLMQPVFDVLGTSIAGSLQGGLTGAGVTSFAGGGYTGGGSRSGGLDGKGGFMAMVHPKERIIDETMPGSGGRSGGGGVNINISVNGARGNAEITQMVQEGVSQGMSEYDSRILPHSLKRIGSQPRRIG